ncbi:hypothetical protein [Candidatus Cyanaurora vandensis]|uniref:hypothetical protein n=1 Tax=Candidatus Cyanaurora vandensis TaxID=2714958 RepID=UPI00258107A5|nr:hypothetical protein [Candidatus Cyanaurora vandensis]
MTAYWVTGGSTSINLDLAALHGTGIELAEKNPVRNTAEPHSGFAYGFKVLRAMVPDTLQFVNTTTGVDWQNRRGTILHGGSLNLRLVGIPIGLNASNFLFGYDPTRAAGGYHLSAKVTMLGRVVLFEIERVRLAFDPVTLRLELHEFSLTIATEVSGVLEVHTGKDVTRTLVGQGRATVQCEAL